VQEGVLLRCHSILDISQTLLFLVQEACMQNKNAVSHQSASSSEFLFREEDIQ
jgi:hypothetical protein